WNQGNSLKTLGAAPSGARLWGVATFLATTQSLHRVTTPHVLPDRRLRPSSNEPIALAPPMIEAISRALAFAPAATPVILYGESGTGKTFFAEYIHQLSGRSGGFHVFSAGT